MDLFRRAFRLNYKNFKNFHFGNKSPNFAYFSPKQYLANNRKTGEKPGVGFRKQVFSWGGCGYFRGKHHPIERFGYNFLVFYVRYCIALDYGKKVKQPRKCKIPMLSTELPNFSRINMFLMMRPRLLLGNN